MARSKPPLLIRSATFDTAAEVLALVFSGHEPEQARGYIELYRDAIAAGEMPLEGLLEARRGGRLRGGLLFQVQPGRTATIWPPQLASGEPPATADAIVSAAVDCLRRSDVRVASALLEKPTPVETAPLSSGGFAHLADLLYLVSPSEDFPTARPADPLEYEPYGAESHQRLAGIVAATYERSLDCPGLDGLRQIDDVLAGYRAVGQFHAQRWLIVRHDGADVGCLLLADHPREENWELVYMGLVAAARGRGWGKRMVRHAQWLARQAGRPRVVLAVDAANQPALDVYGATGFHAWDRRSVFARVFP